MGSHNIHYVNFTPDSACFKSLLYHIRRLANQRGVCGDFEIDPLSYTWIRRSPFFKFFFLYFYYFYFFIFSSAFFMSFSKNSLTTSFELIILVFYNLSSLVGSEFFARISLMSRRRRVDILIASQIATVFGLFIIILELCERDSSISFLGFISPFFFNVVPRLLR